MSPPSPRNGTAKIENDRAISRPVGKPYGSPSVLELRGLSKWARALAAPSGFALTRSANPIASRRAHSVTTPARFAHLNLRHVAFPRFYSWRKRPPDLLTAAMEWLLYLQNLPKAAPKDNSMHGIAVETSRSCGAVARYNVERTLFQTVERLRSLTTGCRRGRLANMPTSALAS